MRGLQAILLSVLLSGSVLFISCITTPMTVTSSTTPLYNKKIAENLGKVVGSHRTWAVFGLWMIGRPDIDKAINDALKKKGGDALINVACYKKTAWFFFVSSHSVVVEGEAVAFDKEISNKDKKKTLDKTIKKPVTIQ